ncbi:MAG: PCMD domain-containing protein [Dysgonamonadaceae bacterium]|jgi:hypothetical protein|nr:PCMD domain-containing protein [Dysgonamonadaceae bacterium]
MNKYIVFLLSFLSLALSSCLKDAPENVEADVLNFSFEEMPEMNFIPEKGNNKITFEIKDDKINTGQLTPIIKISEGATISPQSGVPQDFRDTVTYIVTSENKRWKNEYKVLIKAIKPLIFTFDDWETAGTGAIRYPTPSDYSWENANYGIGIAKLGNVENYPTRPTSDSWRGDNAVLLETQRGGTYFGVLVPVFSASVFRGKFGPINMGNFARSIRFGQPHDRKQGRPVLFSGYFKYKSGSTFYDEHDNVVSGRVDEGSIYSVLFRTEKGVAGTDRDEFLDGTNILTSDKIVAVAQMEHCRNTPEYTRFEIPFLYRDVIDYDRFDYKLTAVFSSSRDGDFYRGADGSTLIVDEVEIVCEDF